MMSRQNAEQSQCDMAMEKCIAEHSVNFWQRYALNMKDENETLSALVDEQRQKIHALEDVKEVLLDMLAVAIDEVDSWRTKAGIRLMSEENSEHIRLLEEMRRIKENKE